jgi:hypothetical protein
MSFYINIDYQSEFSSTVDDFVNNSNGYTILTLKQLFNRIIPMINIPVSNNDGPIVVRAPILADVYYASLSGGNSDLLAMAGGDVMSREEIMEFADDMLDTISTIETIAWIISIAVPLLIPLTAIGTGYLDPIYIKIKRLKEFMEDFPTWYNEQIMNTQCSDGIINADSTVYPVEYLGGEPLTQDCSNNPDFDFLNKAAHYHYPNYVHGRSPELGMENNTNVHAKIKELINIYIDKLDYDRRLMKHRSYEEPSY